MNTRHLLTILCATVTLLLLGAVPYSVNPTHGSAVSPGTITIDGSNNGEWSDSNVIALDMANDDPRSLGDNWTMHESPWDLTHLWAAWDDEALYLAWQYVDVTDILDPANAGSAGGGKPANMDLIQWIVLDLGPGGSSIDMWGKNNGDPYWTGTDVPDVQFYIASNLWQGFLSRAVDGSFPVDDGGINYFSVAEAGVEIAVGDTLAAGELWGVDDVDRVDDSSALRDFVAAGHSGSRDSFYEMRIPLSILQISRTDLEQNGLGVMLGQGEGSCLDTIPNDPATTDTPGVTDWNSPLEWTDTDSLTADFARVGAGGSSQPDTDPEPQPETEDTIIQPDTAPDVTLDVATDTDSTTRPDPDTDQADSTIQLEETGHQDDNACGCRVTSETQSFSWIWFLSAMLLMVLLRRTHRVS